MPVPFRRRAGRCLASSLLAGGLALASPAGAHPHVPGDPFADVGDTIVAGSTRVAPIRSASHQRWIVTDVHGGGRVPAGTIEQRVSRADTPAGRQWCVAVERRMTGKPVAIDSVFVTAGPPIPVYWIVHSPSTGSFTFEGREVNGTYTDREDTTAANRSFDDATFPLAHACYPAPLERVLLTDLDYGSGAAVALALFDPREDAGEYHLAVAVAGETRLDHAGHERRCWLLSVADDRSRAESRTLWIDRVTRALLREEIRNGSGDLLEVLEAE